MKTGKIPDLPGKTTLDRLNKMQHDAYLYIDKHYRDRKRKSGKQTAACIEIETTSRYRVFGRR